MPTVGEKIRAARVLQGLTQADLSGDLVTVSMISQIEMNKTRPSVHLLEHIARRLNLPVAYFTDGLDDVASPDIHRTMAKYHHYTGDTVRAKVILNTDVFESEAKNVAYLLLQVRLRLHEGQNTECIGILEEIREVALATQDQHALLNVYQLSGYVQYGMRNLVAAIHEWERAVTLGEDLLKESMGSSFQIQTILADVLYASSQARLQSGNAQKAKADLQRAEEFSRAWATLRSVADALFQDGQKQQESGSRLMASKMFEKSVWALEIGAGLTTRSRIITALDKEGGTIASDHEPLDPWLHSVMSMTAGTPLFALEANLSWIRNRMDSGETDEAIKRIAQCLELIDEQYVLSDNYSKRMWYQFRSLLAQAYFVAARHEEAISVLNDAIERSVDTLGSEEILAARGLQLKWLKSLNRVEDEKEVIEHIMEILQSQQNPVSYLE